MLDARRAKQKGYITLKEAAQLTNYSPDYIGQLIRSGKIHGEQVYSQVAWVTTKHEIETYVRRSRQSVDQNDVEAVVAGYTKPIVYAAAVIGLLLLIPAMYIASASVEASIERSYAAPPSFDDNAYNESN